MQHGHRVVRRLGLDVRGQELPGPRGRALLPRARRGAPAAGRRLPALVLVHAQGDRLPGRHPVLGPDAGFLRRRPHRRRRLRYPRAALRPRRLAVALHRPRRHRLRPRPRRPLPAARLPRLQDGQRRVDHDRRHAQGRRHAHPGRSALDGRGQAGCVARPQALGQGP